MAKDTEAPTPWRSGHRRRCRHYGGYAVPVIETAPIVVPSEPELLDWQSGYAGIALGFMSEATPVHHNIRVDVNFKF